jgi:ABC-2 type transport system permease protein
LALFVVYAFSLSIYTQSTGTTTEVHNASIGIVDEDHSTLSRRLSNAFFPPSFNKPELIESTEVDQAMENARFMFVLDIPPDFERHVTEGRGAELQLNSDATALGQAGVGAVYIETIVQDEVNRFLLKTDEDPEPPIELVTRLAFNPNGDPVWFVSLSSLVNQVTMLTIILTGAALIREREHGTIEHLMVMPLSALEIALSKVWANGLVILVAVFFSMQFVIRGWLDVPVAGLLPLFYAGVTVYLFFATALGIFLGTVTRTMGQFAMLVILLIIAMQLLSGGGTPIDSQPDWLQRITFFLPSRHFVAFAQAIIYRDAGFDIVWQQFAIVAAMGFALFVISLGMFRRSITTR